MRGYKLLILFVIVGRSLFCQNADFRLLKTLNSGSMPVWDETMKVVSTSVYPMLILTPTGILADGYFKKDKARMRDAYKSAVAIGFAIALTSGLKYLVNRTRPYTEYPSLIIRRDIHTGPYSFPSGHTSAAFSIATTLSLTYKKWYVALPAYSYASLVGYSRMRLGMHYPSDVLGGAVVGIGTCLLTWKLDQLINRKKKT